MTETPVSIRDRLQTTDWHPAFAWVRSVRGAANVINRPHEDYPTRVRATRAELERLNGLLLSDTIPSQLLVDIHRAVFVDTGFGGEWRELDVQLNAKGPTKITRVADWMRRLAVRGRLHRQGHG